MSQPHAGADEGQEDEYQPWYRFPTNDYPFKLVRKISSESPNAPAFRSLSFFPWRPDSLQTLWDGGQNTIEHQAAWKLVVAEYWDAVAVTSDCSMYIFFTQQKRPPLYLKLLQSEDSELLEADKMCVTWAVRSIEPCQPLVVLSQGSILYVYNVERRGIQSYIRGHGKAITSISVHPTNVHLICTTSRDYSARIYDLNLDAKIEIDGARTAAQKDAKVDNPHWPPNTKPSLAGAAHGLRLPISEQEGAGPGRCLCVLMGGRSGGHNAAVLSAAFHPIFPLIATCGMDRTVKIWPVRPNSETKIKREDKPLFSSSMIHRARVMSISWLEDDLLLTHSAPAVMRVDPDDAKSNKTYIEAGELTIWRWLGLNRFFPANQEVSATTVRGISSDYQESSSFKIISTHKFPDVPSQLIAPSLSLYHTPTHDPLILISYPRSTSFTLVNAIHMRPRALPPFPRDLAQRLLGDEAPAVARADAEASRAEAEADRVDAPGMDASAGPSRSGDTDDSEDDAAAASAAHPQLTAGDEPLDHNDVDLDDEEPPQSGSESEVSEDEEMKITDSIRRRPAAPPPPPVRGWVMRIQADSGEADVGRRVMASVMGQGGRVVVAVGTGGSLWVWKSAE